MLFGFNVNTAINLYYTICYCGFSPNFSLAQLGSWSSSISKCDIDITTFVFKCKCFDCIFRCVPGFSARALVPSFLSYCLPTSSQVKLVSVSQRSSFQNFQSSNVQNFHFHLFGGLANSSTVTTSLPPVHSEF